MGKVMPGKCQWMAVNRIKTRAPFNSLFPVDEKTVEAVAEHMRINGYDQSQPLVLWKEKLDEDRKQAIVIDGHTRLLAAKKIGLSPVYVARVSFASADAALEYAIHNQRDRRNLTDADLLRCIEAVDERKAKGQRTDLASSDATLGKSSEITAKIVGTSPRKVEKARTLLDYADEQTKQTVLDGKQSIHAAAKEVQEKRKEPNSSIDKVQDTKKTRGWIMQCRAAFMAAANGYVWRGKPASYAIRMLSQESGISQVVLRGWWEAEEQARKALVERNIRPEGTP